MKTVILGSNSFAGSCLIDHLLSHNIGVIGINRSSETDPIFLRYLENKNLDNFHFYRFNLNRNVEDIIGLLENAKPEYIVDFAGQGMVAESWEHPEQWYQTNIVSKSILHNYLKDKKWLRKYIRISTPEVYGDCSQERREDSPYNPSTPYAVSHAATDMSLNAFYQNYDLPVVVARFANFYGAYQQLYRIIPRTIIYVLNGRKLQLHGGGTSIRSFIHSSDVCKAIDCLMQKGKAGKVYHFPGDSYISIKGLVQLITKKMNASFEELVEVAPDRLGKDQAYRLNADATIKELNWQPVTRLEEGIEDTINWVKLNIDKINSLPWDYQHIP